MHVYMWVCVCDWLQWPWQEITLTPLTFIFLSHRYLINEFSMIYHPSSTHLSLSFSFQYSHLMHPVLLSTMLSCSLFLAFLFHNLSFGLCDSYSFTSSDSHSDFLQIWGSRDAFQNKILGGLCEWLQSMIRKKERRKEKQLLKIQHLSKNVL